MSLKDTIMCVNNKIREEVIRMYQHISEQDIEDAKKIAESIKELDSNERKMIAVYISALRDRKIYAEPA